MIKNKKLLLSILALDLLSISGLNANTKTLDTQKERIYNSVIKNVDSGKSNAKNYKLIENILKKRNKELQDLYLQGDYISKPEYLEWHVIFSGFYNEYGRERDNSDENGKYHSKVSGYYDENGKYIVTSKDVNGKQGKPYAALQKPKEIDLGVNVPISGITREPIELNLGTIEPTTVTPSSINFEKPDLNIILADVSGIEVPTAPTPPSGLGSSGIIIDPTQVIATNSQFASGVGTIGSNTYTIDNSPYNSLYTITLNNETLEFTGNIDINGSSGVIVSNSGNTTITGAKITNNSKMTVKSSGTGLAGFHSNNNTPGYLDFINNNILDIEYLNTSNNQSLFFYGNINLINNNEINYLNNSTNRIKALYSTWNLSPTDPNPMRVENNGTINITGNINLPYSQTVMAHHYGHLTSTSLGQHTVINTGTINLENALGYLQDYSTGIYDASGGGVMNVNTNSVGIEVTLTGISESIFNNSTLKVGTINVDGTNNTSNQHSKAINMVLSAFPTVTIDILDGEINLKSNALGIITDIPGTQTVNNSASINITGENSYGIISHSASSSSGTINNTGDITLDINNPSKLSAGIFHQISPLLKNSGNISVKATGTNTNGITGILLSAGAKFENDGTGGKVIKADGTKATGVFANQNTTNLIKNTKIEAVNNGIGIFSYGGSDIKLDNITAEASAGGLLFYSSASPTNSKITFTSASTANIKDSGTAFYLDGPLSALSTYYVGLNNLTLTMENNSAIFLLNNPGTYSIGVLPTASGLGLNIDPASGNYSDVVINQGTINIDNVGGNTIFDLDNNNDALNKNKFYSSNLNLVVGSTIKGNNANQWAMAQTSYSGAANNSIVTLTNDGIINLGGNSSMAMYANYGTLNNNNDIYTTGESSVAMYGENGTSSTNSGNIVIGNKSVGIYGISAQDISSPASYGDKGVLITNFSNITANSGTTNAIGIYADNNANSSIKTLNLASGTINLAGSDKAVGVYANNMSIIGGGTITVGSNGVGIYANESNIILSNLVMNLNGNNALGYYIEGDNSTLSGSGTINIDGQDIVLFNINSNNSAIDFSGITVVGETPGSSYILGNLRNGQLTYNSNASLASNGTMLNGITTNIVIGASSVIESKVSATGVVAVALDGVYTAGAPITPGIDGQNNGTILLGDSSVGLYGKNGTRLENTNIITVGNSSVGISTSDAGSSVNNSGTITIGANSQGIYLKDGANVENSGTIMSSDSRAIGIYTNNVLNPIINNGTISLNGDRSIGIYASGSPKDVINNNIIKVGDSTSLNDPSIGIYTTEIGDRIINNHILESGKNSIGIYATGATIDQNSISIIGESGTGIYTRGSTVNLNSASNISIGQNEAIGVYGTNGTYITNNSSNISVGTKGYAFVLETNSTLDNKNIINLNGKGTAVYSTGNNTIISDGNAHINMSGDNNIGYYLVGNGSISNAGNIMGTSGKSNIGIYSKGGIITNTGTISVGNSVLEYNPDGSINYDDSGYAVGIYGDGAEIYNSGNINIGENGIGLYTRNNLIKVENKGNITSSGQGATGIFADNGIAENSANTTITMSGDNSIGMVANKNATIINEGTIVMSGNNVTGMFANISSTAINNGTIDMTGAAGDSTVFLLGAGSNYLNNGIINVGSSGAQTFALAGEVHKVPSLVNAGIIYSEGVLALDGISLSIKVNPESITYDPTITSDAQFVANGTSIIADKLITDKPITILPGFADGTNANVYKIANAVKASSGTYSFISGSLLWEATPEATGDGVNIYMQRKSFIDFTDGLWFEEFGHSLEENFDGATGDSMKIYNKTAYIENEAQFRQIMGSLAGNIYSNINQRENDIARTFENSLFDLHDSENNTKENVKLNVIAGKGKNKEETDGVVAYDYKTTGILALREVERTYKHTFGYSLGYLYTDFEFKDGNESKETVNTIQLGLHSNYKSNGWLLKNDLTGRTSFHNIDRNINWPSSLGQSKMDGTYETYSITSDNILGKEFKPSKILSVMPYGAFRAMYITRPDFKEKGLEKLEIEGNDAWSVKPRVGVELSSSLPLGSKSAWKLKGSLDMAYEYELADLNEREKAKLVSIGNTYHKLSKPEDEKGIFRTKASVGVELANRYGIFFNGEYEAGNDKKDDYRVGVTLKTSF